MPSPVRVWSCWVSRLTQLDTTSSGVNPCCCFMQHLATANMPADVYLSLHRLCRLPKGPLYTNSGYREQRSIFSRAHIAWGNSQQLVPMARMAILKSFCIKWGGGGEFTYSQQRQADKLCIPIFLCLLSANPAVVSSSDPNPTVVHCSGVCW